MRWEGSPSLHMSGLRERREELRRKRLEKAAQQEFREQLSLLGVTQSSTRSPTVTQLRAFLQSVGITIEPKTSKASLMELVREHLTHHREQLPLRAQSLAESAAAQPQDDPDDDDDDCDTDQLETAPASPTSSCECVFIDDMPMSLAPLASAAPSASASTAAPTAIAVPQTQQASTKTRRKVFGDLSNV